MAGVAWVTGGGTGIGKALAESLYRAGYSVVISGRRKDTLDQAAAQIGSGPSSGKIRAIPGDITQTKYIPDLLDQITQSWGPVDLLVNNAGENPHHGVAETTLEEYRKALEINCLAAIACTKAVLPSMQQRGQGAIVNISSTLGKWASAGSAAYSVSKYAMSGFTDVLRQDLVGTGIHIMGVYPGFIATAMTEPFVQPGSLRSRLSRSPEAMARAIMKGLQRRSAEIHFPWYVPWILRLHRWMPETADRLARRVKT